MAHTPTTPALTEDTAWVLRICATPGQTPILDVPFTYHSKPITEHDWISQKEAAAVIKSQGAFVHSVYVPARRADDTIIRVAVESGSSIGKAKTTGIIDITEFAQQADVKDLEILRSRPDHPGVLLDLEKFLGTRDPNITINPIFGINTVKILDTKAFDALLVQRQAEHVPEPEPDIDHDLSM